MDGMARDDMEIEGLVFEARGAQERPAPRAVAPELTEDDLALDRSLRPKRLGDYLGQTKVKESLAILIEAARARGDVVDHILFSGPPGLGKTTLAHVLGNEMGVNVKVTAGPAIERAGDLAAMQRNPKMGATQFYKRIVMRGLEHHVRKKSVTTRSSLEYNFVRWVEANEHRWCYEWTRIELGNGSVHIPDFKVQVGKDVWVVETKGFYYKRPGSVPLSFKKEKVTAAWCRSRGYKYTVLDFAQIGKLGVKVKPKVWVDLTLKTDRQIVSYLKQSIPGAKDASN